MPIKYKIGLLKAQVPKSYITFVIEKSYEGRAILPPPPTPKKIKNRVNFYSHRKHQETIGFLIISGEIEVN